MSSSQTLFERMSAHQAPTRRDDPATSHAAAAAVTPHLTEIQRLIQRYARTRREGFTDRELVEAYPDLGPSTLRTRRAELCEWNVILDSMRRRTPEGGGQPHTVWIHRDFVDNPPAITEPVKPASGDDKARARELAGQLDAGARQMRSEGRAPFAGQLEEAAAMMRRLAR